MITKSNSSINLFIYFVLWKMLVRLRIKLFGCSVWKVSEGYYFVNYSNRKKTNCFYIKSIKLICSKFLGPLHQRSQSLLKEVSGLLQQQLRKYPKWNTYAWSTFNRYFFGLQSFQYIEEFAPRRQNGVKSMIYTFKQFNIMNKEKYS